MMRKARLLPQRPIRARIAGSSVAVMSMRRIDDAAQAPGPSGPRVRRGHVPPCGRRRWHVPLPRHLRHQLRGARLHAEERCGAGLARVVLETGGLSVFLHHGLIGRGSQRRRAMMPGGRSCRRSRGRMEAVRCASAMVRSHAAAVWMTFKTGWHPMRLFSIF